LSQGRHRKDFQNIRLFKNMSVLDNVRAAFHCRLGYSVLQAGSPQKKRFLDAEKRCRGALHW
jgi:ABC-type branched-subunit amino acid transport system ATPase component